MKNKIIIGGAFLFILFGIISIWKYIDSFDVKYVGETQLGDVSPILDGGPGKKLNSRD